MHAVAKDWSNDTQEVNSIELVICCSLAKWCLGPDSILHQRQTWSRLRQPTNQRGLLSPACCWFYGKPTQKTLSYPYCTHNICIHFVSKWQKRSRHATITKFTALKVLQKVWKGMDENVSLQRTTENS